MRGKSRVLKVLLILVMSGLFCAATLAVAPAGEVNASCGSKGWYFAEGYTGGDFDTWILIQNPNKTEAIVQFRFFTPNGAPITREVSLNGETRYSLYLNTVPGLEKQEVATEVKVKYGDQDGIIAERAMYFNYGTEQGGRVGGHASIGADRLSTSWYLPEGYTGGGFDTYVLLMNPNEEDTEATLKLMKPQDGKYYAFKTTVPAGTRRTVKLDDLVWRSGTENIVPSSLQAAGGETPAQEVKFDDTDVATLIYSNKGIVAERAMYFDYYGKSGGSNSIGTTCAAPEWYLPEGYTGGDFDTWVMAMNPSGYTVDITYTFYSNTPGFQPVEVVHSGVKPWSRDTIHVDEVEGLSGTDVATKVTATRPVQLAGTEADPVERYAVLFGVEDYPSGADLLYSEDDLYDVKHRLVDYCGFTYDKMQYCTGECATLERFQDAMEWLAENADANDIVVFFFGGRSSVGAENQIDLYDGVVTKSQLQTYFSALSTQKLVGLLSCDNSGELAGELAGANRVLLASCSKGELSYEFADAAFSAASGDSGNGAWARYFVEALGKSAADANGNSRVSAEEAHNYLAARVTPFVKTKTGNDQTPKIYDNIDGEVDLTADKVEANIVAERSIYFNYGTANDGATSIGACDTLPKWFLAEGYTGGGFDTFVLVMNPYNFWQKITATYMTPGGATIVKTYDCPPNYRMTIKVDDQDPVLAATDVSTRISAEPLEVAAACGECGVVVERAMYFTYTDPGDGSKKSGGSCSIGYGTW
ncbi:MAG: caspase family protein [Actinobacteria bacterium]|nr:MAG: caspase family protein [Actinomycetota bacterium]